MSITTPIDPRAVWPLAYLTGRLGYRLTRYDIEGPDNDVITADLARDDARVRVDWFPRAKQIMVSTDTALVGVFSEFAEMADALERL